MPLELTFKEKIIHSLFRFFGGDKISLFSGFPTSLYRKSIVQAPFITHAKKNDYRKLAIKELAQCYFAILWKSLCQKKIKDIQIRFCLVKYIILANLWDEQSHQQLAPEAKKINLLAC